MRFRASRPSRGGEPMAVAEHTAEEMAPELDAQTTALRVVAGLLIIGAMMMLASLLVPFFLAVVVAITLSPLAERIERAGAPRSVGALVCTLAVLTALVVTVGLIAYQAGSILKD